jgi:hypothetical protein
MLSIFFFTFIAPLDNANSGKALFDNFSETYIDGNKWEQREYVIEVAGGKLVSKLGNRSPGMGAERYPGLFRNFLRFRNSNSINSIQCDITIIETKLDSALNARSFARIAGQFYNINDSGGQTGDIAFEIMIGDRGNNGIEAFWEASQIISDNGTDWTEVANGTLIGPGVLQYGMPYTVKLAYDGNQKFTFSVAQISDSYSGPKRKRAAVNDGKQLATCIDAIHGSNNGFVHAEFDNVQINEGSELYDDFSSSPIQMTKWIDTEFIRDITNGYLRSGIIGYGSTASNSTAMAEGSARYFEAKAFIDGSSQFSPGAFGIARIQGYYYNDSRGPGSGQAYNRYEGDVFVQLQLRYNSDNSLSANAYVDRCNDSDEISYSNIFTHNFSVPILPNKYYVLAISFIGKKLILSCNGETAEYVITTPMYPAYGEHRLLRSRARLESGETGFLKVRFGDIYIGNGVKPSSGVNLLLLQE